MPLCDIEINESRIIFACDIHVRKLVFPMLRETGIEFAHDIYVCRDVLYGLHVHVAGKNCLSKRSNFEEEHVVIVKRKNGLLGACLNVLGAAFDELAATHFTSQKYAVSHIAGVEAV
jgi:hypothetical protein